MPGFFRKFKRGRISSAEKAGPAKKSSLHRLKNWLSRSRFAGRLKREPAEIEPAHEMP